MRSTDVQDGHILKTLSSVIWTTWDQSNSSLSGTGDELFTHATQELPRACRSAASRAVGAPGRAQSPVNRGAMGAWHAGFR